MFLFPIYAIAVWFLIARWRRTWRGVAVLAGALLGVVAIWKVYLRLVIWAGNTIPTEGLRTLIWGAGGMIALVGAFILVLPRRTLSGHCGRCDYDLRGHEEPGAVCPECGTVVPIAAAALGGDASPRAPAASAAGGAEASPVAGSSVA